MIANSLPQRFVIYFCKDFFYEEVRQRWWSVIRDMGSIYRSLEDFMNAQIQDISLPNINPDVVKQRVRFEEITKRGGKELVTGSNKSFNVSFKLSESFITYLILRDQYEYYLKFIRTKPLYWKPITIDFLNDMGYSIFRVVYDQLTPISLSDVKLSYANEGSSFKTISMTFNYNYLDYYNVIDGEKLIKID